MENSYYNTSSTRILIVEDNSIDAELIRLEVLKFNSESVIEMADNFKDFERSYKVFKPHIILCDFDLKRHNAFDVLDVLSNDNFKTPCVIITGVINDEETVAKLILNGAVGFIQKKDITHIRLELKRILIELDTSFSSNFNIVESKLRLIHRIKTIQANFYKLAMEMPSLMSFNEEFNENMEDLTNELESWFKNLPLKKK